MKLGEILVEKGLLTPSQVGLAIRSQLMLGGHLGSCLIEQGLIDENTLGGILSTMCGVPYAAPELLAKISPETIQAVPKRVAEQYQVVPIKLEGKAIHLVFVDPTNLRVLDELSFAIGRAIVPWIAPEVRVFQALDRYYGVARRARYIKLQQRLPEPEMPWAPDEYAPLPAKDDDGFLASGPEGQFGYGKSWQEIAAELVVDEAAADEPTTTWMLLPQLAERYCQAETRDDLARAALDFAAGRAARTLLLFVRGNRASVWDERGFSLTEDARNDFTFEVSSEPLFHLLMGNDHYHGGLPAGDGLLSFYRRLGADAPAELLLIPVHVNDQLVAAALADGGAAGHLHGDVDEIRKAFRMFQTAVLMVALRKRIRDGARPTTPLPDC